MKKFTREELRELIVIDGNIPTEEQLDLLILFQEFNYQVYWHGYQDALNKKTPALTKVTGAN